jgi:hypothetical protein
VDDWLTPAELEPGLAERLRKLLLSLKSLHFQAGTVDYTGIRHDPLWQDFVNGINSLKHLNPAPWPEKVQRAFWINLYNVLVLHAVVQGHHGASPLGRFIFFTRKAWQIGSHWFSLDDIEHGILRSNQRNPFLLFKPFSRQDPRVHFALNCAARSCPPIGVYSSDTLEEQLELASASYLHSEVVIGPKILKLPSLLQWYQKDFGGRSGVARLISRHFALEEAALTTLQWKYTPYDWSLNA